MGWLEGDVALISGAGSGLGRALVDRFVAEGARVVAFDRSPERVAAVDGSYDETVVGVVGDVTVAGDNERAVAQALSAFGRLNVHRQRRLIRLWSALGGHPDGGA